MLHWSYRKNPIYYVQRILINSSETYSDVAAGKWASKNDRIRWDRLISYIHENPVETEVHLIARISSICVNIQIYARYIRCIMQWSLCVTSRITMKSQAASSTALVNYSIIFRLKFTTVNVFYKYINKDTKKKNGNIFRPVIFKYSMLWSLNFLQHINVFRIYITENSLSFVLHLPTTLRS